MKIHLEVEVLTLENLVIEAHIVEICPNRYCQEANNKVIPTTLLTIIFCLLMVALMGECLL